MNTNNSDMLYGEGDKPIKAEEVVYFENVKGFYAKPEAGAPSGGFPGVVMVHEWWGLNDNIKDMARGLAKEGYQVLAVDLFDGKVAKTSEEARGQVSGLNQERAIQNLKAAALYLRNKNAGKIASLGWCFGGGQALSLALSGENLDATVVYYGNLVIDQPKLSKIKWPVLGIFGDKDASISVQTVDEFRNSLNALGIKNSIHIYPEVGHAFANPSGQNYAANETKDAWQKTLKFLAENLK